MIKNVIDETIENLGMVYDLEEEKILLLGDSNELDLENYSDLLGCVMDNIIYIRFYDLGLDEDEIEKLIEYLKYDKKRDLKYLLSLDLDELKDKLEVINYVQSA